MIGLWLLWCIKESVNWDKNQQKRKDHTEDELPQLHPIPQPSWRWKLPSTSGYLLSNRMAAACKSMGLSFAGGKWKSERKAEAESAESRDQANCSSSQILRSLPRERTVWARGGSIVQWEKALGNLEFFLQHLKLGSLDMPQMQPSLWGSQETCRCRDTKDTY